MNGLMFSQMEPPADRVAAFHAWYDEEHIPLRLAIPGFERARRYEAVNGTPRYLAVYEISDSAVFGSEAFRELKERPSSRTKDMLAAVSGFTRYLCEPLSDTGPAVEGELLSVNAFNVPRQEESAFDDWYESEHIPRLMEAADWLRVRRYKIYDADGPEWTHLALHELGSADVLQSSERRRARQGPKRDALVGKPWFDQSGRWLYRLIARAPAA